MDHVDAENNVRFEAFQRDSFRDVQHDRLQDVGVFTLVDSQTLHVLCVAVTGLPGDVGEVLGKIANVSPGPGGDLQAAQWGLSWNSLSENSQDWFPVSLGGGVHLLHDLIKKPTESGHILSLNYKRDEMYIT